SSARGARLGVAQELDEAGARLVHVLPGALGVRLSGGFGLSARESMRAKLHALQAARTTDQLAQRQILRAPPMPARLITKGADHEDAAALLRLCEIAREDRHRRVEEGRNGMFAEEVLVASVVRVGRDPDAGRQELRPGRGDHEALVAALDP